MSNRDLLTVESTTSRTKLLQTHIFLLRYIANKLMFTQFCEKKLISLTFFDCGNNNIDYGTKLLHLSFMYLEITELVNLQIQINWEFQLQFRTELSERICIALLSCNNVDEIIGFNPLIKESHKKRKRNYILLST